MTKYHVKKRIDIVVEAPLMRTLTSTLDQARVPGYSVLPIVEGRGMLNAWSSEGQISDAANMVALLCIVDAAQADNGCIVYRRDTSHLFRQTTSPWLERGEN